jgi:hypothetical protein
MRIVSGKPSQAAARAAGLAAALIVIAGAAWQAGAARTPLLDLPGRWTGTGTVQWKTGRTEPYKCIVTYFLEASGASLKQNLRCSSAADHKLDLATLMQIADGQITGTWEEKLTSMKGAVKGKVTEQGFEALAHNQFFNAQLEINMASGCEQSVAIRPSREIQLITANLRKC